MNWFLEIHSASRGFASDPWAETWHPFVIFQCPFFLNSSDLCWLAQPSWNASRMWRDRVGFLCPWHLSWISGKRGYTLNFHHKTELYYKNTFSFRAALGFAPWPPNQGLCPWTHWGKAIIILHSARGYQRLLKSDSLTDAPTCLGPEVMLK